jgi:hypothetical protein
MKNQQEEKKSDFFFAYGSPQFVIGASLVHILLNSDIDTTNYNNAGYTKFTKLELIKVISILILLVGLILCGCYNWNNTYSMTQGMSINIVDKRIDTGTPGGWDDLSNMGKKQKSSKIK